MKPPQTARSFQAPATEVSGCYRLRAWNIERLGRLARLSLCICIVVMLGFAGCVVTGSPEFLEPTKYGPYIEVTTPSLGQVIVRSLTPAQTSYSPIKITLKLSVYSAGEPVWGQCWLGKQLLGDRFDLSVKGEAVGVTKDNIECDLTTVGTRKGCHTLTLIVSYGNFDGPKTSVAWLVNLDDDGTNPIAACPGGDAVQRDGGLSTAGSSAP